MCMDYIAVLDTSNVENKKLEEELLKERDRYIIMQYTRTVSACNAASKKFEGQSKHNSLNSLCITSSSNSTNRPRLPKINVPTFDDVCVSL